ncbi:uncharacterized protein [Triticum aestivum]|uniref:uncharacterized protein n=1 Tax=Triticum aestivum TaxID=4565 RepID=UPI001D0127B8|nr:uncharacterized protein LOC123157068 [Triticum aestivum]
MVMFEQGSMLALENLHLKFRVKGVSVHYGFQFGIEHLASLRYLHVDIDCEDAEAREVETAEDAIRSAISAHPGHPRLEVWRLGEEKVMINEVEITNHGEGIEGPNDKKCEEMVEENLISPTVSPWWLLPAWCIISIVWMVSSWGVISTWGVISAWWVVSVYAYWVISKWWIVSPWRVSPLCVVPTLCIIYEWRVVFKWCLVSWWCFIAVGRWLSKMIVGVLPMTLGARKFRSLISQEEDEVEFNLLPLLMAAIIIMLLFVVCSPPPRRRHSDVVRCY